MTADAAPEGGADTTMAVACTHAVELGQHRVTKRYRSWSRGEPAREWDALTLLEQHAPGLAPLPIEAELDGDAPYIVMSRLGGAPLGATAVGPQQLNAMAVAVDALHRAVPARVLSELPLRIWHPADTVGLVRTWCADHPPLGPNPLVHHAFASGAAWVSEQELDELLAAEVRPVFGHADGNLANHLWDETRVRLVDFEDAGRSDRAFELADAAEHVSMRLAAGVDTQAFLAHFDLSPAEHVRLNGFRRLFGLFWFLMLLPDSPGHRRNPPGTLEHQADRLLHLLGDQVTRQSRRERAPFRTAARPRDTAPSRPTPRRT